ncbi:MAG: polynucleotide adenylyltransferase PcnB, partial [Pseudomonas sp.]
NKGLPPLEALQEAANDIISVQCRHTAIPKRFTLPLREIWDLQERLPRRQGRRADTLLEHPRFRAAYDFLLLREEAGEETGGLGAWWTRYQDVSDSERRAMIKALSSEPARGPRKRRRAPSKPRQRKPSPQE